MKVREQFLRLIGAKGISDRRLSMHATGSTDSTTATGRLVFGIFAALAEFERELIRGRSLGVITTPYKLAYNS